MLQNPIEQTRVSPRPTEGSAGVQGRPARYLPVALGPGSSLRSVRGDKKERPEKGEAGGRASESCPRRP